MNYRLRLTKKAEQVRLLANPVLQKKLVKCFTILQESPKSHPQIKPLYCQRLKPEAYVMPSVTK